MVPQRRFSASDLRAVGAAIAAAERFTGEFYCIPGREWRRYPYDVTTMAWGEPPWEGAFADVVRVLPAQGAPGGSGLPEHFRIRLRDDAILNAVRASNDAVDLPSLLLWVMTHELLHVVRFAAGLAVFEAGDAARADEERRVHRITARVLRAGYDDRLRRAARLCAAGGDCERPQME